MADSLHGGAHFAAVVEHEADAVHVPLLRPRCTLLQVSTATRIIDIRWAAGPDGSVNDQVGAVGSCPASQQGTEAGGAGSLPPLLRQSSSAPTRLAPPLCHPAPGSTSSPSPWTWTGSRAARCGGRTSTARTTRGPTRRRRLRRRCLRCGRWGSAACRAAQYAAAQGARAWWGAPDVRRPCKLAGQPTGPWLCAYVLCRATSA